MTDDFDTYVEPHDYFSQAFAHFSDAYHHDPAAYSNAVHDFIANLCYCMGTIIGASSADVEGSMVTVNHSVRLGIRDADALDGDADDAADSLPAVH